MDFTGKRVIVSGAALGMGNVITREFSAMGAKVLAADILEDQLQDLVNQCRASGNVICRKVDVEQYDSVEGAVLHAEREFGGVDFLINFAGGAPTRILNDHAPFWERKPRLLDFGINVNLRGALYFGRAVFPVMMKNKSGVIVNIGSIDGVTGSAANVEYSAAKSGLTGLTKSLAAAGAPFGIRCVCVIPGPVMTRPGMAAMKTLQGRASEPEELTNFIRFLCSDQAKSMTGSCHLMDCGRAAMTC